MEDIIQIIVNNGLGVASFFCLIYFMNTSIKKTNETLDEVNKSLLAIQSNMITLSERLQDIEKEVNK